MPPKYRMLLSKTETDSFSFLVVVKSIVGTKSKICSTVCFSPMMMAVDRVSIAVTPH